jgi:hypothetical protein
MGPIRDQADRLGWEVGVTWNQAREIAAPWRTASTACTAASSTAPATRAPAARFFPEAGTYFTERTHAVRDTLRADRAW